MSGHSGRRSRVPFARFDRGSSHWRTCRESLPLGNLDELRIRWPLSGIASDGLCWELTRWVLPIDATGASSSLLPTPQAHDGRDTSPVLPSVETALLRRSQGKSNLEDSIALLPTPTARDWKGENQRRDTTCLPGALLPTPTAADAGGSRTVNNRGELLLNGIARAVSTGASTVPLSGAGSESSDVPLPFPEWPDPEVA